MHNTPMLLVINHDSICDQCITEVLCLSRGVVMVYCYVVMLLWLCGNFSDDSNEHLNEDDSNELLNYLNNPKHKLSSMASFEDYENEYEESNEDNKFRNEDNRELFDDDDEDDHYDIEDNDNNSKDDDSEDNEEPYASEKSDWSYTKYLEDKKTGQYIYFISEVVNNNSALQILRLKCTFIALYISNLKEVIFIKVGLVKNRVKQHQYKFLFQCYVL